MSPYARKHGPKLIELNGDSKERYRQIEFLQLQLEIHSSSQKKNTTPMSSPTCTAPL